MKCTRCGAALYASAQSCPLCGYPVPISGSESKSSIAGPVFLVISGALVLFAALATAAFVTLRAQLAANPVYREALALARSSPEIQDLLGQPIQEGWWAFGEIRAIRGSGFAEWTTSLKGPKGRGQLHSVANRIGASWRYSRLLFVPEHGRNTLDITPPPARDALLSSPSPKKIFLVPFGGEQEESLAWAPAYYKAKFGLNVEVLPVIPLNADVWSVNRHQLIAEKLIALMKQALPEKVKDQLTVLIGVTVGDMYIESYDWRYAINYREDGRFAILSTARLRPFLFFQKWNQALGISRLQKMLSKDVYLLCFGVPFSGDYTSAVSGGVMSPEEIDPMSDQIIGAEGRWDPLWSGGEPTVSMTVVPGQPLDWMMEAREKPPADVSSEYFAADLKIGLFIQRKTDFFLDGTFPLQFVRVYRNEDAQSRAFGVGSNNSLDIFLVGQMGTYVELVLEDGGNIRFNRDVSKGNASSQVYRARVVYGSPFSQARALYEGGTWRVETTDGSRYFFPYRPRAQSAKVSALTGYSDPQGHRYEMERDGSGDLLRVTTPTGKWLHFECDAGHRIRHIEDSEGRAVTYEYDAGGRLIRVSDSKGITEGYRYDDKNRMREVLDGGGNVVMAITYSPDGNITSQTLGDGRSFQYECHRDAKGVLLQNQFTDPRGYVTFFNYAGGEYTQSLPSHPTIGTKGTPEPFLN